MFFLSVIGAVNIRAVKIFEVSETYRVLQKDKWAGLPETDITCGPKSFGWIPTTGGRYFTTRPVLLSLRTPDFREMEFEICGKLESWSMKGP